MPDPRITRAVEQLQRRLHEPVKIAALAARVNLSPSRFRHLFTVQTGVGPARYLQQLRLRRARLLIERTFLSVKEVMGLVGYSDPSHFSRDFRRVHGVSPSALRGAESSHLCPASRAHRWIRPHTGESANGLTGRS